MTREPNTPARQKRQKAEARGRTAEQVAALFLRLKGYRILERRYNCQAGEIDLIARKRDLIAFIEVKSRKTLEEGRFSVTHRQQARIIRAAESWLSQQDIARQSTEKLYRSQEFSMRFDVIVVAPGQLPDHILDAFRPNWP